MLKIKPGIAFENKKIYNIKKWKDIGYTGNSNQLEEREKPNKMGFLFVSSG